MEKLDRAQNAKFVNKSVNMAQITLKVQPLFIVTHLADQPVAANANSVNTARQIDKTCVTRGSTSTFRGGSRISQTVP